MNEIMEYYQIIVEAWYEIFEFIKEQPQIIKALAAAIAGCIYIYWPSDPFEIRAQKQKLLSIEDGAVVHSIIE